MASLILKKMHEFTLFRQASIENDYYYYQYHYPTFYYIGGILGILTLGFLSDNLIKRKMYTTVIVVTTMQIVYTILSFVFENEIARGERLQECISVVVGFLLFANTFLYERLLPLKLAREITEKKLRANGGQRSDPLN